MILQALHRLAERENLLNDPDYEPKPVAWLIRVSKEGKLLGIESTKYVPEGAKKAKAKTFSIPKQPGRTSGDKAFFFCDKAEYVFGLKPSDRDSTNKKLAVRFNLFKEQVVACRDETQDEGAMAVSAFLDRFSSGLETIGLKEDVADNDLFAFVYEPDIDRIVTDRTKVRGFWKSLRMIEAETEGLPFQCLVSGDRVNTVGLFPQLKKVPGGSSSGVGLVSYNAPAFESHGWNGNANGPVSRQAAEACATALNRLLTPDYPDPSQPGTSLPSRKLNLSGDTVLLYWSAETGGDDFADALAGLLEPDPNKVKDLYKSVWYGRPPGLENESAFYALTLSGTQGRAIVRDWFESSVTETARNIAAHFQDLSIVCNTPPPKERGLPPNFPLTLLCQAMAVHGDRGRIPAPWIGEMLRAALKGTLYPYAFLQRSVERYRAELLREKSPKDGWSTKWLNDARAGLIKAVLNRTRRRQPQTRLYQEVSKEMDPNYTEPGYNLGQLMAVLESLQAEALGKVNASIVDKYFSGAIGSPRHVFVHLLDRSQNHLKKVRDDSRKRWAFIRFRPLIDELADRFSPADGGFPKNLTMDQQGLFVLGYHQMRKWLGMSKEERDRWNAANEKAPRAFLWIKKQNEELQTSTDGEE